jgi:hypothetical protein
MAAAAFAFDEPKEDVSKKDVPIPKEDAKVIPKETKKETSFLFLRQASSLGHTIFKCLHKNKANWWDGDLSFQNMQMTIELTTRSKPYNLVLSASMSCSLSDVGSLATCSPGMYVQMTIDGVSNCADDYNYIPWGFTGKCLFPLRFLTKTALSKDEPHVIGFKISILNCGANENFTCEFNRSGLGDSIHNIMIQFIDSE